MANDLLKQLGLVKEEENDTPVMLRNPNVIESSVKPSESAPVFDTDQQQTAEGLMGHLATPREANFTAPVIQIPTNNDNYKYMKELDDKLVNLQDTYKKELADAEDRKFKSQIWAAIGNAVPGIVAGATAMNTKASVTPSHAIKVEASDPTSRVDSKYKTDYEGMLQRYKTLKEGQLTPKDVLQARIAQSYLDQGAARLNANVENTDRNAGIRVGAAILKDQKENELSDKQSEQIAGYDEAIGSLNEIKRLKKNIDTGPLANIRNKVAYTMGVDDPNVTSLRSEIVDSLASKIRTLSGTAASDAERKTLSFTMPDISANDETFNRQVEDAIKRVERAKMIREKTLSEKQGKNVKGYSNKESNKVEIKREYSPSRNQTRITYSDGTVEIKDGK